MGSFIASRLTETIVVLLIGSMLCFVFLRLLPGDPAMAVYGEQFLKMGEADRARIIDNLGLTESLPVQYGKWLFGFIRGDWGHSYSSGEEVKALLSHAVKPTILLMLASTFIILVLSIFFGILTGLRRHSQFDHTITIVSFVLMSLPTFWFALMLVLLFSVYLGILPSAGIGKEGWLDSLKHLLLPAIVLALSHIGFYIRILRNHLAVIKEKEFVWALQARGLSNRTILWKHLLPNVSVPFLSFVGLSFSMTLGGSVIIETIFSWPGLGRLSFESAISHDYPVILAAILISMSAVVIGSFLIDLICAWIDPRMRGFLLKENGR